MSLEQNVLRRWALEITDDGERGLGVIARRQDDADPDRWDARQ
jgi:hypothetical protein